MTRTVRLATIVAALAGTLRDARAGDAPPIGPAPAPAAPQPSASAPVVIDDFGHDPLDRWQIHGADVEEKSETGADGKPGNGWIEFAGAESGGGEIAIDTKVADWRSFSAVVVRAGSTGAKPAAMRLRLRTGGGGLVRRFSVEPGAPRDLVLPLRDFRDDSLPRCGDFASVRQIVVVVDEGGPADRFPVQLDELRLAPGTRGPRSCRPTVEERLAVAFPDGGAKALESEHFLLLTDAAPLQGDDGKRLLARIEEAWRLLVDAFRVPDGLADKAPLYVAATREGYVALVQRHMRHFGASTDDPKSDGFTILRRAFSSYDAAKGWDRPTYVHEATHAALCESLGLPSDGNWVQEGMASAVQLRLHPASARLDRAKAFAARAAGEKAPFPPWIELLSVPRPPIARYAELATIFEFLADRHADRLPAVWKAMTASTFSPHSFRAGPIGEALGLGEREVEAAWLAWGLERWPAAATPPAAPTKPPPTK